MTDFRPEHKYAEVNGIKLHYAEAGRGKPVIFLHGFPEFWYSWRKQLPAFAENYQAIAPDLRGYNKSEKPKGVSNYTTEALTRDIVDLIKHLGHEKAYIVAHDWGGAIGWEMGMNYPQMVEKLVILNSPHPSVMKKHLLKNGRQRRRSWYMFFFQIPFLPELMMSLNTRNNFERTFKGWAYNKEAFTDQDIDEYVKAFPDRKSWTAPINYYRAAMGDARKNKQKRNPVDVETLILWGENDKALGKELTYGLDKYFTQPFSVEYLPNCSHWIQHEYPEKINELVMDFFEKNKPFSQ